MAPKKRGKPRARGPRGRRPRAQPVRAQPTVHPIQGLPAEVRDMITDYALGDAFARDFDPRAHVVTNVTEYPRTRPFPFGQGHRDHASLRAMRNVLSENWLWVNLRVKACNRACNPNENAQHFTTWWRKLRTYMRAHFHEVPLGRLNLITGNRTPLIEVIMACCQNAAANQSVGPATNRTDLTMTFAAGPLKNAFFTSLMCKVNRWHYNADFRMSNVTEPDLVLQARWFMMSSVRKFVRDCDTTAQVTQPFVPQIVPNQLQFENDLCITTETVNIPMGWINNNGIRELGSRLWRLNRRVMGLTTAYPLHFMLPWILDVMLLYESHFLLFSRVYDQFQFRHRVLAGAMGNLTALACSGFAQYLLGRENTRASQTHYSIPNRFPHDEMKFDAGEYFWTRLMGELSHHLLKQDARRTVNFRSDDRHDNPEYWCATYQSLAELSLAFARAAIVVGDDDDVLMQNDPTNDTNPMPDIRQNTHPSLVWTVPNHHFWHSRIQAVQHQLARAFQAMAAVQELIQRVDVGRQERVIQWVDKYEKLWQLINKALSAMVDNDTELRARTEDTIAQNVARQAHQGRYNLRRGNGVRQNQMPAVRPNQPLKDPNEQLRQPYLTIEEVRAQPLIDFDFPHFNGPFFPWWVRYHNNMRRHDDSPRYN